MNFGLALKLAAEKYPDEWVNANLKEEIQFLFARFFRR